MRLEEMTADEVQDAASRNIPCILPVGVLEWHGHHNPCGVDLLCSRGVSELVADRIEAVVAPALSYGPGVDAVGSPKHGSLEVGVPVYLPHAAAVVADLVNLGFKHIFCVCHHQGSHGEQGASMRMIAQHYGLNYPSRGERHWWGMLPPDEMVDTGKAPAGRVRRDELPSTTITSFRTTDALPT